MRDLKGLLKQMTIEEKIGQLCQFTAGLINNSEQELTGPMIKAGITEKTKAYVGSVIGGTSAEYIRELQRRHLEQDRNKIPLCFMRDVIHGYKTIYPIPLALGCSFDTDLVSECSKMAAREASAGGIHVTFTPMVDYVRDARWGRVMESCGEDPMLNSLMGATQVKALRGDKISNPDALATCVKHFAAYGGAESGRDYNDVEISEHTLREYYLPAYKACLDAGVDMLMPAFNVLNGVPATANKWLMKTILKEEWGSDVLVISDWGAIGELRKHGLAADKKEAAQICFENGCHIDMCSASYMNHLKELVEEGIIAEKQIDDAVSKVLKLKAELGLFDDPYHGASKEREKKECLTTENRNLVRKAAAECAVLLKNDHILPLSESVNQVAIIGPFADSQDIQGAWAALGEAKNTISVATGIQNLLPNAEVRIVKGCDATWDSTDTSGFVEAISVAKEADVVILCVGELQGYSGEGNCRTDLDLPGMQNKLVEEVVKANSNTVVVLFTGRPLAIQKVDCIAPAILNMWFPGTEGGNAVADLLFGRMNPSGKLSMSFPKTVGQCPIYYNHTSTGRPKSIEEDLVHKPFTSNYLDCGNLPLYSFGHGLSYSNFVYEGLELSRDRFSAGEKITVSVTVHNDSDREGKETVMLYMRDVLASNARPIQQLIAFEKVSFDKHETKVIEFIIEEPMLRFWNNEHKFVSEPGVFRISTGYADHLLHTKEFVLEE